jgi:hypothetical protein
MQIMAVEQANRGLGLPISSNRSIQKNTERAVLIFLRPGLGIFILLSDDIN